MGGWTEAKIRALTPEKRATLLANAQKSGGAEGEALARLILSLHLPLSSGGMSLDHPIFREMNEIAWSAEGKQAMIEAVEQDLPALAGLDRLLQKRMGSRYGKEYQGRENAGSTAAEVMRFMGYVEDGDGKCPPDCIAGSGRKWRKRKI